MTTTNRNNEKIYFYLVSSLMLLMPFAEFISECFGVAGISQTIILGIYGVICSVFAFSYILKNIRPGEIKLPVVFFLTLILFMCISRIYTEEVIQNDLIRRELPVHFLAYFSLMLLTSLITSEDLRLRLIKLLILLGVGNSVIAIFQSMGLRLMPPVSEPERHLMENMVYGLTEHSNHFGGLMVILLGASIGYFILFRSERKDLMVLIAVAMSFYSLVHTYARLALVGVVGILITYIVSLVVISKKYPDINIKRLISGFLIVSSVMFIIFGVTLITSANLSNDLASTMGQADIRDGSFANGRGYIWMVGLRTVPSHLFHGVGLDNYKYAFVYEFMRSQNVWVVDRAHNEFIHLLVTEGVLALINYVLLLIFAITWAVKSIIKDPYSKHNKITWIALTIVMGYLCQAMFNSSVISVAFYFWICLGLLIPGEGKLLHKSNKKNRQKTTSN